MRYVSRRTFIFTLLGAVPVVSGSAGLASLLLLRAGYSFLVWALLPLLALLLIVGCLGVILGGLAGYTSPAARLSEDPEQEPSEGSPPQGPPQRRSDRDDV